MHFKVYISFFLTYILLNTLAQAEQRFELDEIIVSGNYQNQTVNKLTKSVAIITAEDIKQASSNNLVELLAREANVNFTSFTATDKFSSIDIRGMGEAAHSNIIIMLDGIRLNAADLSGADLSTIPLSQIKRIEIIRGSSAVRYGGGAVGGVINIITEPLTDNNKANLYLSTGSFNTKDARASIEQSFDNFSLDANIAYYDTDGYRDNGSLEKKDAKLAARFYANDSTTIKASIKAHHDEYGLPGSVSQSNFNGTNNDRKSTTTPNDKGETDDTIYTLSSEFDLINAGFLQINLSHRSRENPFIIGFTPLLTYQQQFWEITEESNSLDLIHELNMGTSKFTYGINHNDADFNRQENGTTLVDQSKNRNGDVRDNSIFAIVDIPISNSLSMNSGFRRNQFHIKSADSTLNEECDQEIITVFIDTPIEILPGVFVIRPIPVQQNRDVNCVNVFTESDSQNSTWYNNALDLGFLLQTSPSSSAYINFSQSYRNPNVDELARSDNNLMPQTGFHFDTGLRNQFSDRFESSFSLFLMQIEDEIRFGINPESGLSENHNATEKTLRKGVEIDLKYTALKSLYLWSALGFTKAEFKKSHNTIPLVPETTVSLGAEWSPISVFTFSVSGNYVGEQFDGLDIDNQSFEKIDSYQIYNSKVIYRLKNIEFFAGINNITNEVYSTIAFAETYYPMPDRNYYAGLSIAFK